MPHKSFEIDSLINDLNKNGFSILRGLIDTEEADEYINLLESSKNANSNNISGGFASKGSFYLSNAIALSDKLLKLVTSKQILEISKKYLKSDPYLKCHRLYKTTGKISSFPWHTDNKDRFGDTDKSNGLVFIMYLNKIQRGGLEVIPKGYYNGNYSLPDNGIIKKLLSENGTFKFTGSPGDVIICNQALIHRAAQDLFAGKNYSLWFQITNNNSVREQLLLKNHQIPLMNSEEYNFLNIGIKSDDFSQPLTNEKQISTRYAFNLLIKSINYNLENLFRSSLRQFKFLIKNINL